MKIKKNKEEEKKNEQTKRSVFFLSLSINYKMYDYKCDGT